MNPLISVCIPLYNHEKYVKAAINSILNQTFQNFEIVIVDDFSLDNSIKILEEIKDPRIRLIKNPFNAGPGFASNLAMRSVSPSSEFIAFFTSDDLMKPERLAKQLDFLQKNKDYGAVFSQVEMISEDGVVLTKKTKRYKNVFIAKDYSREEWLRHFFYQGNCIASPTGMVRKDCLEQLDEKYGYIINAAIYQSQDFELFVRICLSTKYNIKVLPEELTRLRKRDGQKNLSSDTGAVRSRLLFENEKIINHYLNIDAESFKKVFLEVNIVEGLILNRVAIAFLLAKEALKVDLYYMTNFAINTLFNIVQDQKNIKFLLDKFQFSIKDFSSLMSKYPLGVLSEKVRSKSFFKRFF